VSSRKRTAVGLGVMAAAVVRARRRFALSEAGQSESEAEQRDC